MSIMAHSTRLKKNQISFFLAGFVIGELIWFAGALLGFDALLRAFPQVLIPIKVACSLYLLKLAGDVLLKGIAVGERSTHAIEASSRTKAFMTSLMLTLSNPKVLMFYVGVLPSVIEAASVGLNQVVLLILTISVVLTAANLAYLMIGEKLIYFAAKAKWDHYVSRLFAFLLAVLSMSVLADIFL